jgi:mannose-6-phosphate isomerase-like protein (cupin superfamily)
MKRDQHSITAVLCFIISAVCFVPVHAQNKNAFVLEHANDIAKNEPAPHNGNGMTTVYNYFSSDSASNLVFRERVLLPGSEIGYHLQQKEEIYFIVSGEGELKVNDITYNVKAGDAILTHPGNSHGLKQKGKDDLVVIIDYTKR